MRSFCDLKHRLVRRGRRIKTRVGSAGPKVQLVISTLLVLSVVLLIAATILAGFLG